MKEQELIHLFQNLPPDDFLMALDYSTLENFLKNEKIKNNFLYKEITFGCNLVEIVKLRERMLHCIWEKKILHRIYKE